MNKAGYDKDESQANRYTENAIAEYNNAISVRLALLYGMVEFGFVIFSILALVRFFAQVNISLNGHLFIWVCIVATRYLKNRIDAYIKFKESVKSKISGNKVEVYGNVVYRNLYLTYIKSIKAVFLFMGGFIFFYLVGHAIIVTYNLWFALVSAGVAYSFGVEGFIKIMAVLAMFRGYVPLKCVLKEIDYDSPQDNHLYR
ncbi:MAG: hypothetical protein FWD03_02790 [Defluviitaleaceae bacterium]|nr:hypothetical protein [Defluviitaleaceae bacterium]